MLRTRTRTRCATTTAVASVLAVAALALGLGPATPAQAGPGEASILGSINQARGANGLPALQPASDLADVARRQAERMAASGVLAHNPRLTSDVENWKAAGENVGYGSSDAQVSSMFMASAAHRANILSPVFSQVGTGTAVDGRGRLWVAEVFRLPKGAWPVYGAIGEAYARRAAALGQPTGSERDVRGGRGQDFSNGVVMWSPPTGAHEVHGEIAGSYRRLGAADSALGLPLHDELPVPGGAFNRFQGGVLVWGPATGARLVRGGIGERYDQLGGPASSLGLPVTDETYVAGGAQNTFQRGAITWGPTTGTKVVTGGIAERWAQLGGAGSSFGFPTTDEMQVPGGAQSRFQGGSILWGPSTGTRLVWGAIGERYDAVGGAARFGLPVTEEHDVPGGRETVFGVGRILWSPSTGAHEVYGDIMNRWLATGGAAGPLGLPTRGEHDVPGGRRTTFQGGSLTWSATTGTVTQG